MPKVLLTVELEPRDASLAAVQRKLRLTDDQIDKDFGVVRLSLDGNQYAIMVDDDAVDQLKSEPGVKGPFANPRIEPFGPVK